MILSTLINRYLAQDPEMSHKLAEYKGKILKIEFLGLNFMNNNSFFIFIHENTISISSNSKLKSNSDFSSSGDISPHAIIRGTPLNLLAVGLSKNHVIPKDIEITGDVLLINNLKTIFSNIDIGWTEILSRFTGDHIAYTANRFFDKLNLFKNQASKNLNRDLREYLQEECRFLVPRVELEDFYKNIDDLRDDTERLYTKFEMLEITAE